LTKKTVNSEDISGMMPLEDSPVDDRSLSGLGRSLFWRTFFLLSLLLVGSILAWLQTLRSLEFEPRAIQTAQQIASLVNLSRAALIHSDAIARASLIKTMTDQEGVRIETREPGDTFEPFDNDALSQRIEQELRVRLGPETVLANSVNQKPGLWVCFTIDGDYYWMLTDRSRFNRTAGKTWLIWLLTAAALSLAGAALIARLINKPLKQLSFAAGRVRDGDFDASTLDENVATHEIRAVNIGFNRMTQRLAKIEQDRAIMLAGISHDLRTPLARLRLETELSVADAEARANMAADIVHIDAIIGKFLDYARPGSVNLSPVNLRSVIDTCLFNQRSNTDIHFNLDLADSLTVLADKVELVRVISNLLENAARYGKSIDTGVTVVDIAAKARDDWVLIRVRDHGVGVSTEQLNNLTKPFYRGEAARTEANGAGLGLAIAEKTCVRMGGSFALKKSSTGGLSAYIKLKRARDT
jgi:two-component system osmolarity sensor histidine kinase EnvZ